MYRGPIFDVDVHHSWKSPEDLIQYLPRYWQDHLSGGSGPALSINPSIRRLPMVDGKWRLGTTPEDGSPPGTDYEKMKRQLLEPFSVERALLNYDVGLQSGVPNPQLSAALCRAANQFTVDHWLTKDDRLCGMILVPTAVPEDAVAEIEHWANQPRMVGALLVVNVLGKPFGHPVYDPIYRAASENGLPVAIHLSGAPECRDIAGGNPATMLEQYPLYIQPGVHNLTSMITSGLFEKFPTLRMMLLEWGFSWIPAIAQRLDSSFDILRSESPLVRRLPSEVIREHVRFSSQPFEFVPAADLASILGAFDGFEDLLCFSSDYPHWDADEPTYIASRIPRSWHRKVFYENATRFFGFEPKPEVSALATSGQGA
ncbi:amidohydrolase family protein [Rhodococcus koreensis]